MSLVLRKAVLPKNVSLLKYFKGRPLATAANKKNIGVLSTAVPIRNLKARPLPIGTVKNEKPKPTPLMYQGCSRSQGAPLRFCVSNPHIGPLSRTKPSASSVLSSLVRPVFAAHSHTLLTHQKDTFPCLVPCSSFHTSYGYAKCKPPPSCKCGCPCPFPCGPCGSPCGCNCLPPPCNTPPKCIQYMTGYYYYPYGFWFCGPYHVTGTCTPAGPCKPGGPCGPCGPCPCPCPCPKCCACLTPISSAVVGGDPDPLCKSVSPQQQQSTISSSVSSSYSEPQQPQMSNPPNGPKRSKGGISKFFPFTSVPTLVPLRRMPHTSVPMCPYSTQPCAQSPINCPVYPIYCAYSTDYSKSCQTSNNGYQTSNNGYQTSNNGYQPSNNVYQSSTNSYQPSTNSYQSSTNSSQPNSNSWQRQKQSVPNPYYKSHSDYIEKNAQSRSPIRHKRSRKAYQEVCPVLESPRQLISKEQRDRPVIFPGTFQYANIPHYKKPSPNSPPPN